MAKRALKRFDRVLDKLFKRRTHWLRSKVRKPTVGKPPTFARKNVKTAIKQLEQLTEACLLREHAIQDLSDIYDKKKQWHLKRSKSCGPETRRKSFFSWYDRRGINKNFVYVMWAKKKCWYVGRTLNGKNRPQRHFHRKWFPGVTRIDIYHSKTKRNIPKLECLATHRFQPRFSKIKPSKRKWYSRCPIHEAQKMIRADVRLLFRLR